MTGRVLKWTVPVDQTVSYIGGGPVMHVASQHDPGFVQVWTLEHPDTSTDTGVERCRPVRVVGTGHAVPDRWTHVGSTVTAAGALVWHVFEAPVDSWPVEQP